MLFLCFTFPRSYGSILSVTNLERALVPVPAVVDNIEVKGDEFWDYDQQIDMESFSTRDFYGTLAKQTSEVTAALARQKDQVAAVDYSVENQIIYVVFTRHSTNRKFRHGCNFK